MLDRNVTIFAVEVRAIRLEMGIAKHMMPLFNRMLTIISLEMRTIRLEMDIEKQMMPSFNRMLTIISLEMRTIRFDMGIAKQMMPLFQRHGDHYQPGDEDHSVRDGYREANDALVSTAW